jgi:serine/threonine-protein kinase
MIALVVAGALLSGIGLIWAISSASERVGDAEARPARAQQQSPTKPTGLGISRKVTWDPRSQTAELTITYSAQQAPLMGPFLEVLPDMGDPENCPPVAWQPVRAKPNAPTTTNIDTPCAWSVPAPPVPAQGSVTVNATFPLTLPGTDPDAELQGWLETAAGSTEAATTDDQVTSAHYAAQRLTGIGVAVSPQHIFTGTQLKISLIPEWPSGPDPTSLLYRSPSRGNPSGILDKVAGGESGVRFTDQCQGALDVNSDGLVVTARLVGGEDCRVEARVGNFFNLHSNRVTITGRER